MNLWTRITRLARSLKKLGSAFRDKADYEKAYALHQLQWLSMRRLGF
jgi:hypothetical protein